MVQFYYKKLLLLLCIGIGVEELSAVEFKDNIPSPQSASMIRYGNVETSLFTGGLDFSIPIYSIDDPDFDLSIALRYNSEGFKPLENSGNVGYGWFLQAGGCITREVRNYPDEMSRQLNVGKTALGMYVFAKNTNFNKDDIFAQNANAMTDCSPSLGYNVGMDCQVDVDYAPDIFHFSFDNYRGTFIINNNGDAQIVEGDYVEVDLSNIIDALPNQAQIQFPLPVEDSKITIKTIDGYTYIFGGDLSSVEFSYALQNGQTLMKQVAPSITSWRLSKVIAPNGRSLTYYYKPYRDSLNMLDKNLFAFNQYYDLFAESSGSNSADNHVKCCYTKECILDSISVSGKYPLQVFFYNSLANKKYVHPYYNQCKENYRLDSISIRSSNRTVRRASLSYEVISHILSNRTNGFYWHFLSKVFISGQGSYSLLYNHANSYPSIYVSNDGDLQNLVDQFGFWKSNSLQGLLREVRFPTGGVQRYTFEQHQYGKERCYRMCNNNQDVEQYDKIVARHEKGGARICQVETFDKGMLVEKKTYRYALPNSSLSSGIYYNTLFVYSINENVAPLCVSSINNYSFLQTHIGYSRVEEQVYDNSNTKIASTIYSYDIGSNDYSSSADPSIYVGASNSNSVLANILSGMLAYNGNICTKGKLLAIKHYRGDQLVKSILRRYNGFHSSIDELIPMGDVNLGCVDTIVIFSHRHDVPISRKLFVYPDVLVQEVINDYDEDGLPLMANHMYCHDKKFRIVKESVKDSKDDVYFTRYTYPDNLCRYKSSTLISTAMSMLVSKNRVQVPIERVSGYCRDGVEYITSGIVSLYKKGMYVEVYPKNSVASSPSRLGNINSTFIHVFDSLDFMLDPALEIGKMVYYPYLSSTLSLSLDAPITDYQALQYVDGTLIPDSRYELNTEYLFNGMGRPLSIKPAGKLAAAYSWDDVYPISKTIGNQTSSYSYIPHVGLSSFTDSRGVVTYYNYDEYGRLTETYQIIDGTKQVQNAYYYQIKSEEYE